VGFSLSVKLSRLLGGKAVGTEAQKIYCSLWIFLISPFYWQEWGNPNKEEFYYYMKSYSPMDNVSPTLFIFCHLHARDLIL
jgi:hypothetical protein